MKVSNVNLARTLVPHSRKRANPDDLCLDNMCVAMDYQGGSGMCRFKEGTCNNPLSALQLCVIVNGQRSNTCNPEMPFVLQDNELLMCSEKGFNSIINSSTCRQVCHCLSLGWVVPAFPHFSQPPPTGGGRLFG